MKVLGAMGAKICFLNGPHKGDEFLVKDGVVLTRDKGEEGDIYIDDPKASNPHAEIIKKKNVFYLQDLDSKNGTRLDDQINDCFALKPGLKFKIGQTRFEVIAPPPKKEHWSSVIIKQLKQIELTDVAKELKVVDPPLVLEFSSGLQKGDKWHIYYGPRVAGSSQVDLPLLEPGAPSKAFTLEPTENGDLLFKTDYPDQVLLNKQHIKQAKLNNKDVISFHSSCMVAHYEGS